MSINIKIPLSYNSINNYSIYNNILLIDSSMYNCNNIYNSCNSTTFPIIYSYYSDKNELLLLLNNFTSIQRIGILFDDNDINNKLFLNNSFFFTSNDLINSQPLSDNFQFIINCINNLYINNIDFLTYNLSSNTLWNNYFSVLSQHINIISIGSSTNISYYTSLSISTSVNLLSYTTIYILYNSVSPIKYSYDQNNWFNINSLHLLNTYYNVILIINFNDSNYYFYIKTDNSLFMNNYYLYVINNIISYYGLFLNNSITASIQNINLSTNNGSTLATYRGWICQQNNNSTLLIKNCNVIVGDLINEFCGGICGPSYNISTIYNCKFLGKIYSNSNYSGGIIGPESNNSNIYNSFTNNFINGTSTGGIVGAYSFNCNSINCYSKGNLLGINNGGIFGYSSNESTAINCYSSGILSVSNINNGIYAPTNNTINIYDCYIANNYWVDSAAVVHLTGTPTYLNTNLVYQGSIWKQSASNNSYTLNTQLIANQFNTPTDIPANYIFNSIACSSNGHIISSYVNSNSSGIILSNDYGVNWTLSNPFNSYLFSSNLIGKVAISSDGLIQIATFIKEYDNNYTATIYISFDGGNTIGQDTITINGLNNITISSSGEYLLLNTYNVNGSTRDTSFYYVYKLQNQQFVLFNTSTGGTNTNNYGGITCISENGQHIFISQPDNNSYYVSNNYGNTYSIKSNALNCSIIKMNSLDTYLFGIYNHVLYRSIDNGNTWTSIYSSLPVYNVGINAIGNYVIISVLFNNLYYIYYSSDFGNTFNSSTHYSTTNINAISINDSGQYIVIIRDNIQYSYNTYATVVPTGTGIYLYKEFFVFKFLSAYPNAIYN